jgi:hypothetical protein
VRGNATAAAAAAATAAAIANAAVKMATLRYKEGRGCASMSTAASPVLVRAPEWPAHETDIDTHNPNNTNDTKRLRKLAYVRVGSAPDAEEQERVSGAFLALPVELVDMICAMLLRIGFAHFFSFVCTCRAAHRAVGKRTAIEVMCMKRLFTQTSLADQLGRMDEAAQYPFTELARAMIRSRIEQETLEKCISDASLHCAAPTSECCRTQRAELNAQWRQEPTIATRFPNGTLGAEALRGRHACSVSVAASAGARLLCTTPDGAVLASANRVWTVTSKPASEFTPGYELASAPLMERSSADDLWAAAEGNRIAVCQYTHETHHEAFYDVKIFDNGRLVDEASVSEPLSHISTSHVVARAARTVLEKLWLHKGEVWFAFLHEDLTRTFSWVHILAIQPDVQGQCLGTRRRDACSAVHIFGRIDCISVAADAGDVALLETRRCDTRIWCFDMKTRTFDLVPSNPSYGHPVPHATEGDGFLHQAHLSPDGLTMVVINRQRGAVHGTRRPPSILLYLRSAWGDASGTLQWRAMWAGFSALTRPISLAIRWSPLVEAVFTPCGRRFYALFLATPDSPGGMLRMDTTFVGEVNRVFSNMPPYRLPTKMAWSKDGLFVQTSTTPVGVLRLGLVD